MDIAAPVLFALFVWWFSTGAILFLDGLPRATYAWSMIAATFVLALAVIGLTTGAHDTSVAAAYHGFFFGILIWAWHEMSFLMGYLTGPRRTACAPGCDGWRHFRHAAEAIIYHEVAIAVTAAALVWATWDAPNQIGVWTFLILWGMRLSAKLNVHLGVRNLNEDFLPPHLKYLTSFLRRRPMNAFFPVSVTAGTLLTAGLALAAYHAPSGSASEAGMVLLAALSGLALLEHWLLVLPVPAEQLWSWGLASHRNTREASAPPSGRALAGSGAQKIAVERPLEARLGPMPG